MKHAIATATMFLIAAPAFAESTGDAVAGEKVYNRCKTCHMIQNTETEEVIVKGSKTGPNLWGVVGRTAGTYEGFKFGDDMVRAGEAGLVWDEENLAEYVADPRAFLRAFLEDDKARTRMSFKLRKDGDDVAAYLATFSPEPVDDDADAEAEESTQEDS